MTREADARIRDAFARAGVEGRLHARALDEEGEVAVGAREPVVLASIFKLPLLVAFEREVAAGRLDATRLVSLRPEKRTPGATGISALLDEVRMSRRDLAAMMIAVSDNAAADALLDEVGLDAVAQVLADLGLDRSRVLCGGRELVASLHADAGAADDAELWSLLQRPGALGRLRALDPARTSASTPEEMTRLLAAIWRDEAAPPAACATMRRLMGLQVWPHRLAAGFPFDDVRVSGKTGTLPTIRNEVGVVEYPDERRYAVAVFTRASLPVGVLPQADAVIGATARIAIDALRSR